MRVHSLQHVPFEGPAAIADWATDRGHELTGTRLDRGESLPDSDAFDWLVVLGGPMGATDEDEYAWLAQEKALVADALAADRRVLGVCLGAQILADVLGGEVVSAETPEIGWFPVDATPAAAEEPGFAALGERYEAFHWHGDAIECPPDATRLAATDSCPTQAFVAADGRAVGLQFHLETTPSAAAALLAATDDLPAGPRVQLPESIRGEPAAFEALRARLDALLDGFAAADGA